MRVAVHVDQLWFSAPGGIGTYVRELVPELAAAGADLTLFRSEWRALLKRDDCCWESLTILNYVATAITDKSRLGGALSAAEIGANAVGAESSSR